MVRHPADEPQGQTLTPVDAAPAEPPGPPEPAAADPPGPVAAAPGSAAPGSVAPGFALRDQHGQDVVLGDLVGERAALLVFFPFAFSGICTGELREIRDDLPAFANDAVQVAGISCDPVHSLRAWADAEGYRFPLLSDFWPHGAAARSYGVFLEDRGFATRGSILVDAAGVVRWRVVHGPGEARDPAGYREALARL